MQKVGKSECWACLLHCAILCPNLQRYPMTEESIAFQSDKIPWLHLKSCRIHLVGWWLEHRSVGTDLKNLTLTHLCEKTI